MRIVAYVRVSTTEQVDHGQGLNIQRAAIRRWAKDNGHRVVEWCADEGVSGAKCALDRPGLTDALTALRTRKGGGPGRPRPRPAGPCGHRPGGRAG